MLPRPARLYLTPSQALRAVHHRLSYEATARPVRAPHRVDALGAEVRDAVARGDAVVIACPSDPGRVAASLGRRGLDARVAMDWAEAAGGGVACLTLDIAEGFAQDGVLVLPIDGLMRHASSVAASLGPTDDAPRIGDVVVHLDHGVARLMGLREVQAEGIAEERAALAFADDAELLVPVGELDRIWRYGTDAKVGLDRMGGEAWRRKRAEIEAGTADTARRLSEQAAARAAPAIEPPRPDYDRHPHPAHDAVRPGRLARGERDRDTPGPPPAHPHLRLAVRPGGGGARGIAARAPSRRPVLHGLPAHRGHRPSRGPVARDRA